MEQYQNSSNHMSLYKALEIPVTASYYQVRKSFHRLARKISPDRHLNHPNWPAINERFAYLIFAHEILKDPETRVIYDAKGFHGLRQIGVSIPAGFQDHVSSRQDTLSSSSSSTCPTKIEKEDRLDKGSNHCHNNSHKDLRRRQANQEKIRLQKEAKEVFHFAVYKQVVKIAWKKELMSERENLKRR